MGRLNKPFRKNPNTHYPNICNDIEKLAIVLRQIHITKEINLATFKHLLQTHIQFRFIHTIIEKLYYDIYFATDVLRQFNLVGMGILPNKYFYTFEEYCYEKETCYPAIEMNPIII